MMTAGVPVISAIDLHCVGRGKPERQIATEPREVSLQMLSRAERLCLIPEKINTQPVGFNNPLAQDLR